MYSLHYYDVVLVAVAASLGAGVAVGAATRIPTAASVPAFAGLALVIVAHALFVNGPVDAPRDLADEVDVLD